MSSAPEITPELAAKVVKDYLLPMFESDGKKLLRKKKVISSSPDAIISDDPTTDEL